MNTGVKITAFTAALAATFAAAYGVGAATGPLTSDPEPAAHAKHNRPASPTTAPADTAATRTQRQQACRFPRPDTPST